MHEIAGTVLVPTKRRNLPQRILRAIDDALHVSGLPRCVRATFAEICRYVSQAEPFKTIFPHKSQIADRIGASEATVYRHLGKLEAEGLIERLEQERKSRNGRFAGARIRLTRKGAELVGLVEPDSHDIHSSPSLTLQAGYTLTEPTISKSHPPKRTENGLPIDLAPLTGKGLSRAGIFALMAKAKAKGKRLSDIVIAISSHITELRGGRLFTYLAKLASGPTCFAVAASVERKRQADAWQASAFARKCTAFRERFAGVALTDREQSRLFLIDERARYAQVLGGGSRSTVPLVDLAPWIERIETGKLVLATLAAERKLIGEGACK